MALVQFSDVNLDFEPHPVTGDVVRLTNDAAVKRSVRNLVLMNFYEQPYDTLLGSGIRGMLFENNEAELDVAITHKINYVLKRYEPRVELIDVIINNRIDENAIDITIKFFVGSAATPDEVNIFLERVR